jgi:formamidopyrimidine-DNA glycosylase
MPELPEVETICRGLRQEVLGSSFTVCEVNRSGLRVPFPINLEQSLVGKKILEIARRAKYILVHLSGGMSLIIHLGMSGKILIENDKRPCTKHDHLVLHLDNGKVITLNDPRRFGLVELISTKAILNHQLFATLGPEPLGDEFTDKYLEKTLKNKKLPVKLALMDNSVVVGVGNIYCSESLFRSKISPLRSANSLSSSEMKILVANIKETLQDAINAGGSSLRDYQHVNGDIGRFQHNFLVYGREGKDCKNCADKIVRIVQGGRSTFYCPSCQI